MQYIERHIGFTIFSFLLITIFSVTNAFAGKKLLENWNTTPALDTSWGHVGGADTQVYISSGELHHILRPYSASVSELPINARHRFASSTASSLTKFQTTVRIEAIGDISQTPELAFAAVELGGLFYNTTSSPTDGTGDVLFRIRYGDRGSGLEVWLELLEFTDGDYIGATEHPTGTIAAPLGGWQIGQDYIMQVIYDGDRTFTATFNGTPTVPANIIGPVRMDSPDYDGKWIRSRIYAEQLFTGDPDANMLHVVYDDIQVGLNANPLSTYDNFDGADAALSLDDWHKDELIRTSTVTNNMLKLSLETTTTDTIPSGGVRLRANLPNIYADTDYFQADMKLEGTVIPDGTRGEIRATGTWGNGKYTSEASKVGSDGNISFEVNLKKSENPPFNYSISCWVSMCSNAACDSGWISFPLNAYAQADPDTMYTASLRRTGTVYSCKVTNTVTREILFSDSVDPTEHGIAEIARIGEVRKFWVSVRNNPGEVVGYIDNVFVEGGSSILFSILPIISSQAQN